MSATSVRRTRTRRSATIQPEIPAATTVPSASRLTIQVEVILYGLFFGLAVLSRFWDLGRRALHHDESLHAQFSWLLSVGKGYVHDPLMHGPFLFHANALAYLLFGANDATSRIVPAMTGCILVMVPWLLRDAIGRWGALFTSLLFLISPGFLYYSRFIRHDIYTATASLLLFACIIKFINDRRARWVYLGALALIWAYSNHEISYAQIAINVSFLAAIIIWRLSPRLAAVGAGALVVMGFTAVALPKMLGWTKLPPIPWEKPTQDAIVGYLGAVMSNPMIMVLMVEGIIAIVIGVVVLRRLVRDRQTEAVQRGDKSTGSWFDMLFGHYEPGSVPFAFYRLLKDQRTLWGAIILFSAIFVVLFTTMFSNLPGILSGLFGAIGYWLGQHDVRRGEQPWFYYLIMMPQYELLAVTFGGVMTVLTIVRGVQYWLGRRLGSLRLLTCGFLVYWGIFMFAVLSWAGEKMPWLITHASLPFIVLAGALLGEIVERLQTNDARLDRGGLPWGARHRATLTAVYATLMVVVSALFVFGAAEASAAETPQALPVMPAVAAMLLLTVGYGLLVGYRRSGLVASLTLAGILMLTQTRIAWIASFQDGDVPKEQIVYVQTAPDVTRVMSEIERLSEELTGGKTMNIIYDGGENGVAWPFEWYLRDFKNKRFMPEGPTSDPGPDWPVVVVGAGNRSKVEPFLQDYEGIEYVLRWHYPEEETYRGFAIAPELRPGRSAWKQEDQPHGITDVIASAWQSIAAVREPAEQARLWRYFMYREPYAPLGSFNFILYVRKDALRYFNGIRY